MSIIDGISSAVSSAVSSVSSAASSAFSAASSAASGIASGVAGAVSGGVNSAVSEVRSMDQNLRSMPSSSSQTHASESSGYTPNAFDQFADSFNAKSFTEAEKSDLGKAQNNFSSVHSDFMGQEPSTSAAANTQENTIPIYGPAEGTEGFVFGKKDADGNVVPWEKEGSYTPVGGDENATLWVSDKGAYQVIDKKGQVVSSGSEGSYQEIMSNPDKYLNESKILAGLQNNNFETNSAAGGAIPQNTQAAANTQGNAANANTPSFPVHRPAEGTEGFAFGKKDANGNIVPWEKEGTYKPVSGNDNQTVWVTEKGAYEVIDKRGQIISSGSEGSYQQILNNPDRYKIENSVLAASQGNIDTNSAGGGAVAQNAQHVAQRNTAAANTPSFPVHRPAEGTEGFIFGKKDGSGNVVPWAKEGTYQPISGDENRTVWLSEKGAYQVIDKKGQVTSSGSEGAYEAIKANPNKYQNEARSLGFIE
jgi:hypothetical protein